MNIIEEQYRDRIHEAEKKLKNIENIPSSQWRLDNDKLENSIQIYTHAANEVTTYKLVKELNPNTTDLEHYKACFTTLTIRKQCMLLIFFYWGCILMWSYFCIGYPGINDVKLLHRLGQDINVVTLESERFYK